MKDGIPLSIAIPAYNRSDAVRDLLKAIEAQSLPADDILVSDDASTDGIEKVVEKYTSVRLLRHLVNIGMVHNWNSCLDNAKNDWICLVHDDDKLAPEALQTLRRACALAEKPALIVHQFGGDPWGNAFRCKVHDPGPSSVLYCPTIPSGAIVHREIINTVGTFDTRFGYSADLEYFARIAAVFPVIVIENPCIVEYRLHGDNHQFDTWRRTDFYQQFEDLQRTILKYAGIADSQAGQEILEERIVSNLFYMLNLADQIGDRKLVRLIAERLQTYRHRFLLKQRITAWVAAKTGWRLKRRPVKRLRPL